jgi:hypothetical protein
MKRYPYIATFAALVFLLSGSALPWGPEASGEDQGPSDVPVRINGSVLTPELIGEFTAFYGVAPVPGDYWYDAASGLYGVMGQQAAGMMMAGHPLGEMPPNASGGNSGVFINGRELTSTEVTYITRLLDTPAIPGRYWLDAFGNCGLEGFMIPLVNFYEVSRIRFGAGGGDNFWSSHFSAGNYDSGNTRGYVSVPGHGPVGYGF